jgi:hypothetical protein
MSSRVSLTRIVRLALVFLALVLVALVGSLAWWWLLMDHGWPGPPPILHAFYPGVDGENAYDLVQLEMFFVMLGAGALALLLRRANSPLSSRCRRLTVVGAAAHWPRAAPRLPPI